MMTNSKTARSMWTSASTLCIGDYVKISGDWSEITQILAPQDGTEDCVLKTSAGIVEAKLSSMIEIAA